jgi:hypothetical protein
MAKKLALFFGIVFVLVGILGFIPNPLVGPTGIFDTDMMHNIVHVVFGLILLAVAMWAPAKSALWMIILGIVYIVLAIIGLLMVPNGGQLLGLVATNMADHWLHAVLGIVLIIAGFMTKGKGMAPVPASGGSMPPPAAPMA